MAVSLRYEVGALWAPENDEGKWGEDGDDQDGAEEQDEKNGDANSKDDTDNGGDDDPGAEYEKKSEDDDDGKDDEEEVNSARNLRYRAWIVRNRKYVEEPTSGRVGFVCVPNTGRNGQNDLVRRFFGQIDKDDLIVDERWNGGGEIPTRFIEPMFAELQNPHVAPKRLAYPDRSGMG